MNLFRVIAFLLTASAVVVSLDAAAASRGLDLEIKASETANAPTAGSVRLYEASYALVIGNDAYNNWPRLSNAVKDAQLVAKELERKGFEVSLKLNVTSRQLKSALEDFYIERGSDKDARLLVWYAGHGETLNGEGYLVPVDAPLNTSGTAFKRRALSLRRFGELVRQAEAKHAMAVFDSCFAGTIFGTTRDKPPAAVTRSTALPVRQFLTSGDAGESVKDDGTFRKLFIRALRGEERADANGDGYLTGSELGNFLGDRVVNLQIGQTPRYGKLRDPDYDLGDFVFALGSVGGAVAAPSSSGGFDLKDLQRQEMQDQIKLAWSVKLKEMKSAYALAQQFEKESGSSKLKSTAWQRFVTAFADDNPFSSEDDGLRRLAASRVEFWMGQKKVASVVTPLKPKPASPAKPAVGIFPKRYTPGDTFKDCYDCPEMVVVPAGSFRMGDLNGGGARNEKPVHSVTIFKPFAVGRFEVTFAEWDSCVADGGCGVYRPSDEGWGRGSRPVINVNWYHAKAYAKWLSGKTGHIYKLLSESQWEYVARAGSTSMYHVGNSISWSQAKNDTDSGTITVGLYPANSFGLRDVHGNVREWVEDCWNENYSGAPTDGAAWLTGDCLHRVFRGGAWSDGPASVRSSGRLKASIEFNNFSGGFRVARYLTQ